jgi:chromosome segregation ATPase
MTTNIKSLKESNLKLRSVMEEMLAKIESKNGELASFREKLEGAAQELEKSEMERGTQIGQLKKLVDHLQSRVGAKQKIVRFCIALYKMCCKSLHNHKRGCNSAIRGPNELLY